MFHFPQRKFLLLGIILGILLLVEFVNVDEAHPVSGLSGNALNSLCNSAHMQSIFPPPKRLSDEDFDKGIYSAGDQDSWLGDESEDSVHWSGEDEDPKWEYERSTPMINTSKLLQGNATTHFRDNLRPEHQYITGWGDGGFTNQFMGITNLLFLSILTPHRIPIIPPFVARPHLPVLAGYRAASDFFDLERWAHAINKEVLEWKDVKDLRCLAGDKTADGTMQADARDELGCWSVWATVNPEKRPYTNVFVPDHANLDISYTPVPQEARLLPTKDEADTTHVTFNALARLTSATATNPNPLSSSPLSPVIPSFHNKALHPPDTQLVCFDFLYRVSTSIPWEWEKEVSNAWNLVGRHAYWSDHIRSLVRQSLAKTLEVVPREILPPIRGDRDFREDRDGRTYHPRDLAALRQRDLVRTPYIAVHARHGDFLDPCMQRAAAAAKAGTGGREMPDGLKCAPGLATFERLIEEVEQELHRRGVGVQAGMYATKFPVIVTSDETDEEWWAEVARYGWKRVQFPPALDLPEAEHGGDTHGHPTKMHKRKGSPEPAYGPAAAADGSSSKPQTRTLYDVRWERMAVEVAIQGFAVGFVGTHQSTMSLLAKRRVEHWQGGVTRIVEFFMDGRLT